MYSWKQLGNNIGLIVITLLLALVGIESYNAYMAEHTYYYTMVSSGSSRRMIIGFIIASLFPLWIIFKKAIFSRKQLGRGLLSMMVLGGVIHVSAKGGLANSTGFVIYIFNLFILFSLISLFIGGIYSIGSLIYTKLLKHKLNSWSDSFLSLGLGLGTFILVNYVLVFTQLFFWPLAWIQLIAFGYFIWISKHLWKETGKIWGDIISTLRKTSNRIQIFFAILIIITLVYIIFSFNLSYIPYSTAWDANHAYMYYPKVRSLNNGLFFSDGPVTSPYIWMTYIAYRFSLFKPLANNFTIAPDTVAVVLNNISGWFSLIFGLGASATLLNYFKEKKIIQSDTQYSITFGIGRIYFLLWLMSGMGAFLVFVDNKTDLGVMSLTMLALMSGFIFIQKLSNKKDSNDITQLSRSRKDNMPALLSGFFFSLAVASKPTAFQDVVIFLLFIVGIFIGILGIIGIFLLILAVLGKAETMSMVFYVSKEYATKLGIIGILSGFGQIILSRKKKLLTILHGIFYRGVSILFFLVLIKGSYIIIYQSINNTFSPTNFAKSLLLGQSTPNTTTTQEFKKSILLVADTGEYSIEELQNLGNIDNDELYLSNQQSTISPNQCSLDYSGLTSKTLYDNLGDIEGGGLTEDLGRYIGFGQRIFKSTSDMTESEYNKYGSINLGYTFLKILFHNPGCYGANTTAKALCENPTIGQSQETIEEFMKTISSGSNQYKFLEGIIQKYENIQQETDVIRKEAFSQEIQQNIKNYVEGNIVKVDSSSNGNPIIAVPYAFLTPVNVIFNWSLQNLSSYYTDIGFIWIFSLILLLIGTVHSIYNKKYELLILHLVTIAGWILWWFLASGIIWYAVGIIAWTTFANSIYLGGLITNKTSTPLSYRTSRTLIALLLLAAITQTIFNLVRIASQGSSGPFVWYKGMTGKEVNFLLSSQGFGQQEIIKTPYKASDVFNLQFGHYNSFINHIKERNNEDGVLIAGTYLQYFLDNQNNIFADGLLTELWKWGSDNNTCNLNLRLQDKKIKYIVIDPNIGSVVMGEGNATLFDRFMAKVDKTSGAIIEDGTMTMLVRMIQDGYLRLISTNNMGAKYAFSLSTEEIKQYLEQLPEGSMKDKLNQGFQTNENFFRAKLAVPRFFPTEANDLFGFISIIFQERLSTTAGIADIADILGKEINTDNIVKALSLLKNAQGKNLSSLNKELTDDERTVLGYYASIQQRAEQNDIQAVQEMIGQLLQSSIVGGSQLITFERTY